jgi:hypothetical protein
VIAPLDGAAHQRAGRDEQGNRAEDRGSPERRDQRGGSGQQRAAA